MLKSKSGLSGKSQGKTFSGRAALYVASDVHTQKKKPTCRIETIQKLLARSMLPFFFDNIT